MDSRPTRKSLGNVVNQAISNLDAPALFGDVIPDVIKIAFSPWRYTMRHYRCDADSASKRARPRSFTSPASSRMES
jgi:hypothetical protein